MELTIAEQIMYSVLQLNMLDANSNMAGTATGFLVQFCIDEATGNFYPAIVTNRHVVDGCDKISALFTKSDDSNNPIIGETISVVFQDKDSIILHPNPNVDLAAILIGKELNAVSANASSMFFRALPLSLIPDEEEWKAFDAVEQVLMVGYPRGLRDAVNNLPIFRRGITATHPSINYFGMPEFLVDLPCFEGCSGSPVFLFNSGTLMNPRKMEVKFGTEVKLLGVEHAIPNVKNTGTLKVTPVAATNVKLEPELQAYLNLGFVIKSTELNAIDAIIRNRFSTS